MRVTWTCDTCNGQTETDNAIEEPIMQCNDDPCQRSGCTGEKCGHCEGEHGPVPEEDEEDDE